MTNDPATRRPPRAGRDRWLALAVFLTLAATYVATLLPGLGGTEDTPKFQYIGAALGTPHDPGYPLYMIVTWAWSKLPIGTLAYRINLLSAVWGALAGALVFLAARRLAVPRGIAACLGVGLGLGRAFWEHSTYAEAYTQVSALTAAALLALLVWDEDGRARWLYAAVAAVSLAFGTHLIVVGMVPAFAWFVLSRYRWRVPLRVLAVIAVIVALGVAQYGYVWWRTVQGSPYLESSARSLREMVDVLRARQFENQTFKDPLLVLAAKRVPKVGQAALAELGYVVALALGAGLVVTWRTRRRAACLLALGAGGPALLLSTLGDVATRGIQLPAMMPCWVLAGAGFGWLWDRAATIRLPAVRRAALTGVATLAVTVPAWQAWQNFDASNSRHDTYYMEYFDTLFDTLQGPAAFVDEGYIFNHMIEYEAYTTQRPGVARLTPHDPDLIARLLLDGTSVYAFPLGFGALDGRVRVRPITLMARPLDERLRLLRDGRVIVIAGHASRWPALGPLGLGDKAPRAGRWVVIAVKGAGSPLVTIPGFEETFAFRAGDPIGSTGQVAPADLRIEMRGGRAAIAVDGQPAVATDGGLVVAELGPAGTDAYELRGETLYKAPLNMGDLPLYRVTTVTPAHSCAALESGAWSLLADPGREARLVGHIDSRDPTEATWSIYLGSSEPLEVALSDTNAAKSPTLTVKQFARDRDGDRLREQLVADGIADASDLLAAPAVTKVTVRASMSGRGDVLRLDLGGLPSLGLGRVVVDGARPDRANLCAGAVVPLEPDAITGQAPLYLGAGGRWAFGAGWHNPDPVPAGYQRRTGGAHASLLLPVERPAPITLRMSLEPLDGARAVAVTLNGRRLPEQPLTAGIWNDVAWPAGADLWRAGVNQLAIDVFGTPPASVAASPSPSLRVRGVALDWSDGKSLRE